MKVLGIGYGRQLFDVANAEHKRLVACASVVTSFDQVVFTKQKHGCKTVQGEHGFTVHPTNSSFRALMLFDAVLVASDVIRKKGIEVVTTQDPFEAGLVGLLLKWRFPHIRLQVQEHGDVLASPHWRKEKLANRLRYHLGLFILKRADIVRVVSERTEHFLADRLPKPVLRRLPVVIDVASYGGVKKEIAAAPADTFTFLTAARFVPQKNLSLLITAFAGAYEQNHALRLCILGTGPQESVLRTLTQQHQLTEVVTIADWTDDLLSEMRQADAYVLSSNYEGWGRVLIEAMLVGLPTVTTDVGCVGEVFKDEVHGLVVPVAAQNALTQALIALSTNQSLYADIALNLQSLTSDDIPGTDVATYAQDWAATMK